MARCLVERLMREPGGLPAGCPTRPRDPHHGARQCDGGHQRTGDLLQCDFTAASRTGGRWPT